MEFKELKKQPASDLHRILAENRDKLRELRFKDANKQLKNVREIRAVKQEIAQVLTLLNQKKFEPVSVKDESASDEKSDKKEK